MDTKVAALAVAGLIITVVLFFLVDKYLAGIVLVIVAVIIMSLLIMQDSSFLPEIDAELSADAKAVTLKNSGNAAAVKIHAMLIPLNIEFDVPSLDPEEVSTYQLGTMVGEVKVNLTFENEKGVVFRRTSSLSALAASYDPLKPMFPVFGWK